MTNTTAANGKEAVYFGMSWEDAYGYAQAIKVGDTIYVSGQSENAFELFMWIMNVPQWPARILPFSCAMYELLSGLTARTSRHQLCKPQQH